MIAIKKQVVVSMPRFKFSRDIELIEVPGEMGMK